MSLSEQFLKRRFPKIFSILLFEDSRKVGFGLWGIVICTFLVYAGKIPNTVWFECFVTCSILVGGGTLADKALKNKEDQNADKDCKPNPAV